MSRRSADLMARAPCVRGIMISMTGSAEIEISRARVQRAETGRPESEDDEVDRSKTRAGEGN